MEPGGRRDPRPGRRQPEAAQPARPARPAQQARPRHTRQRGPASRWRRAILVGGSAAAALVLLVGVGVATGVVHVSLSDHSPQTVLTAVSGCSQLEQADGTLQQVNGSSLVIKTASGQPVIVTTTASTFMNMSGPLLSDITDGASVTVHGHSSGGTFAAAIVTVGQPFRAVNPAGFAAVQGTVADASTAGFTLVTSGGGRVRVTTSGDTLVVIPHASPGQLQVGAAIFALGHAGPDGTLLRTSGGGDQATRARQATHQRVGKGLLAQLDRRGARRDQRGARPRPLIRPTPMMGWHGGRTPCQPSHPRTGQHRLSQREAEVADVDRSAGGDRSAGREPGSLAGTDFGEPISQ